MKSEEGSARGKISSSFLVFSFELGASLWISAAEARGEGRVICY